MNIRNLTFKISALKLSKRDKALCVFPFAKFPAEHFALIDDDEAVGVFGGGKPFERARGVAFEVHAGDVIPRTEARAFELSIAFEPVGNAAQEGADDVQGDE